MVSIWSRHGETVDGETVDGQTHDGETDDTETEPTKPPTLAVDQTASIDPLRS